MNQYETLKKKHSDEVNAFPIAFAFNRKQFTEALEKLGATVDEVVSLRMGGLIRKVDVADFKAMFKRQIREHKAAIKADEDGTGYISDMFLYELRNHEFGYTLDPENALFALDLTEQEVENSPVMCRAFEAAKEICIKEWIY